MSRGRRSGRTGRSLTTISWRDIPAQVTATADGVTEKLLLPARFQHAIDRAAAVADKTEAHAYVAEWRRSSRPFEGEPAGAAAAEIARLRAAYPKQRLDELVRSGGLAPEVSAPEPSAPTPVAPDPEQRGPV